MFFKNQAEYEHYHSPEQRRSRMQKAEQAREAAVTEALSLYLDGDIQSAKERLFSAGIQEEGISYYLNSWR